jgi:acylphosphatase
MKITRHLIVKGRVQGVGYRQFFYVNALKLACTGWVRNRVDGTVEAVAHGTPEAVDRLIAIAHRGPRHAQVAEIAITPADGIFTEFKISSTA